MRRTDILFTDTLEFGYRQINQIYVTVCVLEINTLLGYNISEKKIMVDVFTLKLSIDKVLISKIY